MSATTVEAGLSGDIYVHEGYWGCQSLQRVSGRAWISGDLRNLSH